MTSTEELFVSLPALKNGEIADTRFVRKALCALVPSIDFFSTRPKAMQMAKEVCSECSVSQKCLHFSILTEQEYGVWGGRDEHERRPLILKSRTYQQESRKAA